MQMLLLPSWSTELPRRPLGGGLGATKASGSSKGPALGAVRLDSATERAGVVKADAQPITAAAATRYNLAIVWTCCGVLGTI